MLLPSGENAKSRIISDENEVSCSGEPPSAAGSGLTLGTGVSMANCYLASHAFRNEAKPEWSSM